MPYNASQKMRGRGFTKSS